MFLPWVLPKFTGFNKLFQSENVVILSLNEKDTGSVQGHVVFLETGLHMSTGQI